MENKLQSYLQSEFNFSPLDASKIIYALKAILFESSKMLIILLISMPLGYADDVFVLTVVLISIRCNSGGLHFAHYLSCLGFTLLFYASVLILSEFPLTNTYIALGLLISMAAFSLSGPITSVMRPPLTPKEINKYTKRVIILLLLYSVFLLLLETLPYKNVIYWVIVLQIFQLSCAKIARKGGTHEKVLHT